MRTLPIVGLFLVVMFVGITSGCDYGRTRSPLPAGDLLKYQSCEKDQDCVYVLNGTCDCNNGGASTAINRSQLDAFKKRFTIRSQCTLRGGPRCNQGLAICENKKCVWKSNSPEQKYQGKELPPSEYPPPPPPSAN